MGFIFTVFICILHILNRCATDVSCLEQAVLQFKICSDVKNLKPTDLDAGVVGVRLASLRVGEQNVLGFQVPVDYAFGLQDPHGPCNLLQENPNGVLAQRAFGCGETRGERIENKLKQSWCITTGIQYTKLSTHVKVYETDMDFGMEPFLNSQISTKHTFS